MHGHLNKSFRFHLPIDYTWRFSKRFPNGIYRLAFHNYFWLFLQSSEQTATKIFQWCWIYSVWFLCCIVLISICMIKWSQFPFVWVYVSFRFSSLVREIKQNSTIKGTNVVLRFKYVIKKTSKTKHGLNVIYFIYSDLF